MKRNAVFIRFVLKFFRIVIRLHENVNVFSESLSPMSKLLLLSCCAPCSCAVIKKLAQEKRDFAVLFYNPNIHPVAEYEKRLKENERYCQSVGVEFIALEYDPERWFECVKGLENEPERGKRCSACFAMRLKRAAGYAKMNGFDCISSVLGVSRYKDFAQVTQEGKKAAGEYGLPYDETNWRKGGLEFERAKIIRETRMYAQNYCGCVFSNSRLSSG